MPNHPDIIALLDVDNTLVGNINHQRYFNVGLIEALAKKGVRNVYLFTNMTLKLARVAERQDVVRVLHEHGLNVLGVISPADVVAHLVKDIRPEEIEQLLQGPFTSGDAQNAHFQLKLKELEERCAHKEPLSLGEFFKDFVKKYGFKKDYHYPTDIHEIPELESMFDAYRSVGELCLELSNAKLSQENKYPDIKGIMFEYFLKKKSLLTKSIIVVDDSDRCIEAITQANQSGSGPIMPLTTIWVSDGNKGNFPDGIDYASLIEKHIQQHKSLALPDGIKKIAAEYSGIINKKSERALEIEREAYDVLRFHIEFSAMPNLEASQAARFLYNVFCNNYKDQAKAIEFLRISYLFSDGESRNKEILSQLKQSLLPINVLIDKRTQPASHIDVPTHEQLLDAVTLIAKVEAKLKQPGQGDESIIKKWQQYYTLCVQKAQAEKSNPENQSIQPQIDAYISRNEAKRFLWATFLSMPARSIPQSHLFHHREEIQSQFSANDNRDSTMRNTNT